MEDRIQINVEPGVKGIIARLEPKTYKFRKWLLIISHVLNYNEDYMIMYHACIDISEIKRVINEDEATKEPKLFGLASHYDFYKPTEEELNIMRNFLKKNNLKFVKGINKMFDR